MTYRPDEIPEVQVCPAVDDDDDGGGGDRKRKRVGDCDHDGLLIRKIVADGSLKVEPCE